MSLIRINLFLLAEECLYLVRQIWDLILAKIYWLLIDDFINYFLKYYLYISVSIYITPLDLLVAPDEYFIHAAEIIGRRFAEQIVLLIIYRYLNIWIYIIMIFLLCQYMNIKLSTGLFDSGFWFLELSTR